MNTPNAATEVFLPLERRDLIRFEQRLRRLIGIFLPHEACSLYFPGDGEERKPEYLPDEERLLLPLYAPARVCGACEASSGTDLEEAPARFLGVFVIRGVKKEDHEALKARLPQVAEAAMENIFAYKAALCDSVTGLLSRRHFLSRLTREVGAVRDSLRPESPSPAKDAADPEVTASPSTAHPFLAVLVIRLHGLKPVVRKYGYGAVDDMLSLAGRALRDVCPEQGTTARISDYEFAVLMPAAAGGTARRFAAAVIEEFAKVGMAHELTRSRISVSASIGYALYPQDITGNVLLKPSMEQAHILLRKARLAAALAAERLLTGEEEPVLAFGRILAEGGRVTALLPLSRVGISLGSSVNAREGQRFSVYASGGGKTGSPGRETGFYKGEAVLIEVKENSSIAEIIHQADPSVPLAEGDSLILLPGEVWGASRVSSRQGAPDEGRGVPDPATGLLRHGDFLAAWSEGREKCDAFSLALLRIAPHLAHNGDESRPSPLQPDALMAEAVRMFNDVFGSGIISGRYGLTSLMAFHPGVSPEELLPQYREVCSLLSARLFPGVPGPVAAAGLAGHPYLDFRKADALESCNKALEYAILLPDPHVGAFGSLAMTISADKRFSHGDFLGAMTEYKQALLADDANALAWNSLGVTLARLGRHDEARGHFDRALALEPEAMTLYNMGYSCQCLGEKNDAGRYYEACLAKDPGHMYALVRLGQLAENNGDFAAAREWYGKAGEIPGESAVIRRHLAGLALKEGKKDEAREHLHEALSLDPQNAAALWMLAEIYLDGGEDAEVAESLARQSVALSPGRKSGWLTLARALERAGRHRDAREALMRAGSL